MKKLPILTFGFVVGFLAFGLVSHADTHKDNDWYVAIKFNKTGKLLQLSDRFSDQYTCISSKDFQLHAALAKESGSNIVCTNSEPDYK